MCTDRIRKLQQSYILLPEWILIGRDRWDRRPWFSVKHPHLPDCCWWYRSRTTSETTVPRTTRSRFTQRLHSILLHNSVKFITANWLEKIHLSEENQNQNTEIHNAKTSFYIDEYCEFFYFQNILPLVYIWYRNHFWRFLY